ncbi:CHAT domain-containing protein, partial [Oscillatoriales cyanobacterium LEGE 11467]
VNNPPESDNPEPDSPPNIQDPPPEPDPPLSNPELNPDLNTGTDDGENLDAEIPETPVAQTPVEQTPNNPEDGQAQENADTDIAVNVDPPDSPLDGEFINLTPETDSSSDPPPTDTGDAIEIDVNPPSPNETSEPISVTEGNSGIEPANPETLPDTGQVVETPTPNPETPPETEPISEPLEPETDAQPENSLNLDVDWSVTFNPITDTELDLDVLPEFIGSSTLTVAWHIAELLNGELSVGIDTNTEILAFTWGMPEADRAISLRMPYSESSQDMVWSFPPADATVAVRPKIQPQDRVLEVEVIPDPTEENLSPETESSIFSSPPSQTIPRRSPEESNPIRAIDRTRPDRPQTSDAASVETSETPQEPPTVHRASVSVPEAIESDEIPGNVADSPSLDLSVASPLPTRADIAETLADGDTEEATVQIERLFEAEYKSYFEDREDSPQNATAETMRNALKTIETQTGKKSVIIYALTLPKSQLSDDRADRGEQLNLVLVVPEGPPIVKTVDLDRHRLRNTVRIFLNNLNSPRSDSYLPLAQELYHWLVRPLEEELEGLGIDTLIFSMDAGLRQVPLAALHDGRQFLVERYSIGSVPSLSLTNTQYKSVRDARVLAMGASEFPNSDAEPLPAVLSELSILIGDVARDLSEETDSSQKSDLLTETSSTQGLWPGLAFIDEAFTLENLIARRQEETFSIVHLATHAQFDPGRRHEAYIQLWDDRLSLDGLRQARWYAPPVVELLVLSACETAVGDEYAELGFAGLAVRSGAKSALASLWKVSDMGSLALMSQFYRHLKEAPIKAEALRQAQLGMLRGEVFVEGSQLAIAPDFGVSLPPELGRWGDRNFSHPYYWAGFTMVGSPW